MRDGRRGLALAVTVGATIWLLLLVATPYAASHEPFAGVRTVVAAATYAAGGLVCHQRPERSFGLWDIQMPVCARCGGLYAAAPFGALLGMLTGGRRRGSSARRLRVLLVVTALPTVAAVCGELVGLVSPTNMVRAILAVPLGFAITWTVCRALIDGLEPVPGTD